MMSVCYITSIIWTIMTLTLLLNELDVKYMLKIQFVTITSCITRTKTILVELITFELSLHYMFSVLSISVPSTSDRQGTVTAHISG